MKYFITFLTSEACNRILLFWLNTWLKIGLRRINWSSSTNEIPSPRKDGINIVVHDLNDALSWQWCNYTFLCTMQRCFIFISFEKRVSLFYSFWGLGYSDNFFLQIVSQYMKLTKIIDVSTPPCAKIQGVWVNAMSKQCNVQSHNIAFQKEYLKEVRLIGKL